MHHASGAHSQQTIRSSGALFEQSFKVPVSLGHDRLAGFVNTAEVSLQHVDKAEEQLAVMRS